MAINSYKQDENINDVGKLKTLGRLFSYLLAHKASIVVVLLIMAYCVCVSLVNPPLITIFQQATMQGCTALPPSHSY